MTPRTKYQKWSLGQCHAVPTPPVKYPGFSCDSLTAFCRYFSFNSEQFAKVDNACELLIIGDDILMVHGLTDDFRCLDVSAILPDLLTQLLTASFF